MYLKHWALMIVLLVCGLARAEVLVLEGEAFTVRDARGWKITAQDDSYASHSYGGMWVSHGAVLSAPAASSGSVATRTVEIPAAGQYRLWSKYQSPPYFNFLHKIEVVQGGKTVLSRVYGKVDAPRLYSFIRGANAKPYAQLWWFWGVDHDAAEGSEPITLDAGPAEVRLVTVAGTRPAGDPMVDFLVLTTEMADTYTGMNPYRTSSPFAREAFAANTLYVRFRNTMDLPARMDFRAAGHFQPDYSGSKGTLPVLTSEPVPAGEWSPWINLAPSIKLVHEEGVWFTLRDARAYPPKG